MNILLHPVMRQCPRCKVVSPKAQFPMTSGGRVCYCRTCKNAVERAAKKKNVAYIAMERERSRIRMRLKRQKNDDAMRQCDMMGIWIALEVHSYIPTPVEEIEYAEAWEEHCQECFPLSPERIRFRPPTRREDTGDGYGIKRYTAVSYPGESGCFTQLIR